MLLGFLVMGVLHSYADYATIADITYYLSDKTNTATIQAKIPNNETVRIPKYVSLNGKKYLVVFDDRTSDSNYLCGDNIKDLYIETDSVLMNFSFVKLNDNGFVHVTPKVFDQQNIYRESTTPITDGKRIKVSYNNKYSIVIDGITYGIKSSSPFVKTIAYVKSYTTEALAKNSMTIPSDIEVKGVAVPVTIVLGLDTKEHALKDIYYTRAIPTKDFSWSYFRGTIHVPDSLFNQAYQTLGSWCKVTNGTETFCKNKYTWEYIQDGFTYHIYQTSTTNKIARIKGFPNQEVIKVPANIQYNGNNYPVDFEFFDKEYDDGFGEKYKFDKESISNLKEIYFTRSIPKPQYHSWPINIYPEKTIIHVPDSLFDSATNLAYQHIITNEQDWYYAGGSAGTFVKDGFAYEAHYPLKEKPYAVLTAVPNEPSVTIPSEITDSRTTYTVSSIKNIQGENIKDLYFTSTLPDNTSQVTINQDCMVHVPDSLFGKVLSYFCYYVKGNQWISDGTRLARYNKRNRALETKYDGFLINLGEQGEDATSVTITDYEDKEEVHFPATIIYGKKSYPVRSIYVGKTIKENVKEVHFSNVVSNSLGQKKDNYLYVDAYVPDSLFDKALQLKHNTSDYSSYLRKITDGTKIAIMPEGKDWEKPYYLGDPYFYDINGNGKMDLIGYAGYGQYTSNLQATSLDGELLKREPNFTGALQMGMFDKEGLPLIIGQEKTSSSISETNVWSYAKGDWLYKDTELKANTIADINGDGRKEIIGKLQSGYVDYLQMMPDGTFGSNKLFVTSDTTEIKATMMDNYTPNSSAIIDHGSSSSIGSLADGMFVESRPRLLSTRAMEAPTGDATAADMNGDCMIDLADNKNIYYNLGGNKLFKSDHAGTVYSADLTGNGVLDYIDFSDNRVTLYLNKVDGKESTSKVLLQNAAIKNVFFGDFDKDGDVDILFIIPGNDYQIFQFYRNDGNGVFKAKDTDIDGNYTCLACNDYDGDGLYEILAKSSTKINGSTTYEHSLLKCNKNFTITEEKIGNISNIGDVDNDGISEVISYKSPYVAFEHLKNYKQNSRPEKMSKPTAVSYPDTGKLKISWRQGKDAETSSCDLTYELRIGSEPGKGDIFFGKANADGTRRIVEDGNMGRSLKYLFDTNNLCEGKYYIALQAVDASGLGGAWSDELVYDHKLTTPVIAQLPYGHCVSDTITLSVQNPVSSASYEWQVENGEIISHNGNNSIVKATFEKAGTQKISLLMTVNDLSYEAQPKSIILAPAYGQRPMSNDGKTITWRGFMDIDQDGNAEVIGDNYYAENATFYELKDGKYSQIRKTWNSDLKGYSSNKFFIADLNHDGYPDFYFDGASKGNVYYNSGEGDKSYDYETISTSNIAKIGSPLIDLNNDGKLSLFNSYHTFPIYTQTGDGMNFEEVMPKRADGYNFYPDGYFDFNRDGSIDIWKTETDSKREIAETKVYFKVSGTENTWDTEGKVFYANNHSYKMAGFADFNNDGYVDGYYFDWLKNGSYNMVIVKGKPMSEWPCTQTVVIPVVTDEITLLDFDNNGYLDILEGKSSYYSSSKKLLLMDKDFQYTEVHETGQQFNLSTNDFDEYNWMPLTRGAYPNGFKSSIKNEAPSMPSNVTATKIQEGLLLKWDDATDDQTPWMQMRYNVSLKKKGQTGKNAFVLSPLNGLSDDATICTGIHYRKATQLVVPTTALEDGQNYEVQVQAIDLMGEHSAMTKPVEFTYQAEGHIVGDDSKFYAGMNHIFAYRGASRKDFTIDPGEDGIIKKRYEDAYGFTLSWKTPGVKTIIIQDGNKTIKHMINVKEAIDLSLNLPKQGILVNTPVTIKVPKCFNASEFDKYGFVESEDYKVSYNMGDSIATITFKASGNIAVKPYVKVNEWDYIKEQVSNILNEEMPEAEIKSVEADGKFYRVNWDNNLSQNIDRVEICRETNRLNQFEVLARVNAEDGTYVDQQSDNRIQPQRYRIRLIAKNGLQASDYSTPHNPLHVMINKTTTNGYNLMWNSYEGLDVASYIIMRGTAANKLKAIAEIAGSQQNYTDTDAPEGISYYAVTFRTAQVTSARGISRTADIDDVSSNVISSEEAQPTTMATSIHAGTVESVASLTQSQQQLHLTASILPTYSTYNQVRWAIVSGNELASISQSGLLTALGGKGDVTIRVTTLDGSNLSDEITIPCDVIILANNIDIRAEKKTVEEGESITLNAVITPRNATIKNVKWESSDPDIATIDENGILKGITSGNVKITAYAKDGSAISSWITIQVVASTGIRNITIDDNKPTQYYDLEGRKIDTPQKGHLYITNKGKKIVY